MIANFLKIQKTISSDDKKKLILSLFVKLIVSITEMLSVASFIPFLSLIANRDDFLKNSYVLYFTKKFSLSESEIYMLLIFIPLILIIFLNLLRPFSIWLSSKINSRVWIKTTTNLFDYYLNQDYLYHVEHGSNALLEKLLQRSNSAIAGVIYPVYEIFGCIFSSIFIISVPLIYNPYVTVITLIVVVLLYATIYQFFRKKIIEYGRYSPQFSTETYKLVEESFKSYKDIKVKNNQKFFLDQFFAKVQKYQGNAVNFDFFSSTPKAFTEIFAFSLALLVTFILLINSNYELNQTVIILGIFLLATQRLVPVIQNFFIHYSKIKFHEPSFNLIYDDLVRSRNYKRSSILQDGKSLLFNQSIKLDNIKFTYPNNDKFLLRVKNFKIKKGEKIGISGKSGFGKSTFINILCGLLHPTEGEIIIDENKVDKNSVSFYQKNINYVPQNIFILNDTIKNNIAFGIHNHLIDENKIRQCAKFAGIDEYIEKELDNSYETIVGENAVKLSGGQRQRIGLARAFYDDKDILILDEATNSLDKDKELEIFKNLNLLKEKTIIIVTHNPLLLKELHRVVYFDKGVLKETNN